MPVKSEFKNKNKGKSTQSARSAESAWSAVHSGESAWSAFWGDRLFFHHPWCSKTLNTDENTNVLEVF